MKKINRIFTTSFFILLLFTNCSQDEQTSINTAKLLGVWIEDSALDIENQISRLEYHFNDKTKFEVLRKTIDKTTGEVLGYTFRQLGDFNISGDQLTFFNTESFFIEINQEPYTEIDNLTPIFSSEPQIQSLRITFKDNDKILVFLYPPCGPTENCIDSQTFKKE